MSNEELVYTTDDGAWKIEINHFGYFLSVRKNDRYGNPHYVDVTNKVYAIRAVLIELIKANRVQAVKEGQ